MNPDLALGAYPWTVVITSWILTHLLHSTVCVVVALTAARITRAPELRVTLWRAALVLPFLTATLSTWRAVEVPSRAMFSMPPFVAKALARTSDVVSIDARLLRSGSGRTREQTIVVDTMAERASTVVLLLALFGVVASSVWLVLLWNRATRPLRTRRPLRHGELPWSVSTVSCHRHVTFTIALDISTPVALRGAEICLSGNMAAMDADECRALVLHEMAHVERYDAEWGLLGQCIVALAWWQPLARVLLKRMRRDAEFVADATAVHAGASPVALLRSLTELVQITERLHLVGAPLIATASPIVVRAERILTSSREPATMSRLKQRLCTALFVIVGLAAASMPRAVISATSPMRFPSAGAPGKQVVESRLLYEQQLSR